MLVAWIFRKKSGQTSFSCRKTRRSHFYNLNQYTGIDNGQGQALSLQYNLNGNLQSQNGWTYSYDYENRLINAANGTITAAYSYDAFGQRTSKRINESNEVTFLYDGDRVIAEYDAGGALLRKYIYGPGIDEPIMLIVGEGLASSRYYYHFDGLGSVTELTNTSGAVVEKYAYDVYGKTLIKDASDTILAQSAVGNRFGFTGRELDSETGLYYYRARMYSPELGRFLQTDPIGYYDSMNLYQYCSNNPVNFVDPWGLCKWKDEWSEIEEHPWIEEDFAFLDVIFDGVDLVSLYSDTESSFIEKISWTPFIVGPITTAAVRKGKKIVIGETMERVVKKAKAIGAEWYKPRKLIDSTSEGLKKALYNNYQWLRRKVKQGYEIVDIGIDKTRETGRSIFYEAEKRWLRLWGK